jgi:hypothetical protein
MLTEDNIKDLKYEILLNVATGSSGRMAEKHYY